MDNPPSYNEAVNNPNPSAPLMSGHSPSHVSGNLGWNQAAQPASQNFASVQHMQQPIMTQPVQQTVVIINQQIMFGRDPIAMMCPNCHQQTISRVHHETSWITHVAAGILCLMGWCPCAIIPYCTDCLKDAVHKCSKCNAYLGTNRRSGQRRY